MPAAPEALLTDLYQLTMLQAYLEHGMTGWAAFEFFVRKVPKGRNFLVAAGLEDVLAYLEGFSFGPEELEWLRSVGLSDRALEYLRVMRFEGTVWAVPEGTPVFAGEPLLRVEAPLPQAQLVETRVINLLHLSTLIASKAVRARLAARDRTLVDFGFRRAHGAEAGLLAARASYIAGFDATATVAAGRLYGIPVAGTMAHSFVQAHEGEREAFLHFALSNPERAVLLIDTYDTLEGARIAASVAPELEARGIRLKAVRLDSGDLSRLTREVRSVLDEAGLDTVGIFCSGGLDEYAIDELVSSGAPVDGFGVGTLMDTSADAPYLDCAYKLVEYMGRPRRKRSEGKATLPGRKQVWRRPAAGGLEDVISLEGERVEGAEPLLRKVMERGKRIAPQEPLGAIRVRLKQALAGLPEGLLALGSAEVPVPRLSPGLEALMRSL